MTLNLRFITDNTDVCSLVIAQANRVAKESLDIKNHYIFEENPQAVFLTQLSKYETLLFFYVSYLYQSGIKKINFNPTEAKNFYKLTSTKANEEIKKAFESLRKTDVFLLNKSRNEVKVARLISAITYDLTNPQNTVYSLNSELIEFFSEETVMTEFIKLKMSFEDLAALPTAKIKYLFSLLKVASDSYQIAQKRKYKDFLFSHAGFEVDYRKKTPEHQRKILSLEIKRVKEVLKYLQEKKAFHIEISSNYFTIKTHSKILSKTKKPTKK